MTNDDNEINYRFLRRIQQTEKTSPKLSDVKNSLYDDILDYITKLREREKKEEAPQKKKILSEEINNTKKIVLDIYEKREKKILLSAISKARGAKPDISNMLEVEKSLFNSTLELVKNCREKILTDEKIEEKKNLKKKEENEKTEKRDEEKELKDNNPVIRMRKDMPEFIGTDTKKYLLKKDDIISITFDMCEMLCKRNASKKIDMRTKR